MTRPVGVTPKLIQIEKDLLSENDKVARQNRQSFVQRGIFAINLISGPGAGKTTLLVNTLKQLLPQYIAAVIEGDQETANDAARIRETGAPAFQINTGKMCHLDAAMIHAATQQLCPQDHSFLFIENVGNLVCPTGFDLGEAHKIALVSVTDGEDKPLKYPHLFAKASLMLITKWDLQPYVECDVDTLIENARRINPGIGVIKVSAKTQVGMDKWLNWLHAGAALQRAAQ